MTRELPEEGRLEASGQLPGRQDLPEEKLPPTVCSPGYSHLICNLSQGPVTSWEEKTHSSPDSRRWCRTGKPGMLQSMESQRVGHDLDS